MYDTEISNYMLKFVTKVVERSTCVFVVVQFAMRGRSFSAVVLNLGSPHPQGAQETFLGGARCRKMVICGHEDLLFFLVFTSFSLGRKMNNFFFRSSLLFGQENGHLRTCPPYYFFFFRSSLLFEQEYFFQF